MSSAPAESAPESPAPSRGERRREELLRALAGLLEERPLREIGIGDISERAGVGRSAFYFYFPSKAAAVTEILHEIAEEILGGAEDLLGGGADDPAAAIRAAISGTADAWVTHGPVVLGILDASSGDDAVRALWEEWMDNFRGPVTRVIAGEQAEGRAVPGARPGRLADALLSMNERTLERLLRSADPGAGAGDVVDALVAIWLTTIYGDTT